MRINPFVADIGGLLPDVISGSVIVSVVLSLPTTGPMLLSALKTQDVNLAATFLLFVAVLTVDRHADLGPGAGRARSAHPLRRDVRRSEACHDRHDTHRLDARSRAARRTSSPRSRGTPTSPSKLTAEQERYYMAGQWKLMWWRFRRHKPAVVSMVFLLLMYFSTLISEWIAPYDLHTRHSRYIFAPPQSVHLFHEG